MFFNGKDEEAVLIEIDPAELAVRLCEANYGLRRPRRDPLHALAAMDEEVRAAWLRSARAAVEYIAELCQGCEPDKVALPTIAAKKPTSPSAGRNQSGSKRADRVA